MFCFGFEVFSVFACEQIKQDNLSCPLIHIVAKSLSHKMFCKLWAYFLPELPPTLWSQLEAWFQSFTSRFVLLKWSLWRMSLFGISQHVDSHIQDMIEFELTQFSTFSIFGHLKVMGLTFQRFHSLDFASCLQSVSVFWRGISTCVLVFLAMVCQEGWEQLSSIFLAMRNMGPTQALSMDCGFDVRQTMGVHLNFAFCLLFNDCASTMSQNKSFNLNFGMFIKLCFWWLIELSTKWLSSCWFANFSFLAIQCTRFG